MPNKTAAGTHPKEASTSPTFPHFIELPPEVRAIIWEHSFGGPRVFRTKPYDPSDIRNYLPMVVNHKPPPSSQACREARNISKNCGKFMFGQHGGSLKCLWFNPSKDILYWDRSSYARPWVSNNNLGIVGVNNVAFDWCGKFKSEDVDLADWIAGNFRDCQRIIIVMEHQTLPDGDVQFLHVNNHDDIRLSWWGEGIDFFDWERAQETLQDAVDFVVKGEEDTSPCRLPPLEPVEVVPIRPR